MRLNVAFPILLLSLGVVSRTRYPKSCPDAKYCRRAKKLCHDARVSTTRDFYKEKCPCTCDLEFRVKSCCRDVGVEHHCLGLCSYEADLMDRFYKAGVSCLSAMQKATYCVSQGRDVRRCCSRLGLSPANKSECWSLCRQGRIKPLCSLTQVLELERCAEETYPHILDCYVSRAKKSLPRWNVNHTFPDLFCVEADVAGAARRYKGTTRFAQTAD